MTYNRGDRDPLHHDPLIHDPAYGPRRVPGKSSEAGSILGVFAILALMLLGIFLWGLNNNDAIVREANQVPGVTVQRDATPNVIPPPASTGASPGVPQTAGSGQ